MDSVRRDMLVGFGVLVVLQLVVSVAALIAGDRLTAGVAVAAALLGSVIGHVVREKISTSIAQTVRPAPPAPAPRETGADESSAIVAMLSGALDKLTRGDLTATIDGDVAPAFAQLKSDFNAATAAIRELIGQVMATTGAIRTGSSEIAHASEDLARRTEGSAASIEQTSAAIAQMDDRLKATAQAATRTVTRADQTISTVTGGRSVADEAVQAMGRVSESAKGIDSVIAGLDKIAFQTRVLAMNAAVEAGRAGDAGRGFAVVADLVSALAMRAEEEAKRARDQLTTTQADIVTAVQAVERVDGALADISSDVDEVHKLLNTIAEDNQAQATAITEINAAIGSMDQATQQNAAMVEQTSAAARNLSSEVETLAAQANRFSIGSPAQGKPGSSRAVDVHRAPVKPLPAEAIAKLTRPVDDDWNAF
jgi:methyl-accepting chemotaxis protein